MMSWKEEEMDCVLTDADCMDILFRTAIFWRNLNYGSQNENRERRVISGM
jgi:hypothetical protein